ncbi:MAG TPA: C40 family peptidase [Dyella sp.]|nr:C40 family peptidase [Dyella sp.]
MTIKPLTALAALAIAVFAAPAHAADPAVAAPSMSPVVAPLAQVLPLADPASRLAVSVLPTDPSALLATGDATPPSASRQAASLRQSLVGLAMALRHIRYVRGGRVPATGFDCSGFVHYVFAQAVGLNLPANAASQFLAGLKVSRREMQPGDLVFFRTAGRRGRISHVGIYLDNGQFIHSPSRGQTVRVDNLADAYWARHFAGAARPEGLAQVSPVPGKG